MTGGVGKGRAPRAARAPRKRARAAARAQERADRKAQEEREQRLQAEVCRFLHVALPELHPEVFWTSFGASDANTQRGNARRAEAGAKLGRADILVLFRGRVIIVRLAARMPATLSDEFRAMSRAIIRGAGAAHHARSVEQVQAILLAEGVPLRASLA